MKNNLLVIKNLNVINQSFEKKGRSILNNINMELKQNEIIGLVGESGSGKSVLINAIGCNITPPLKMNADLLTINDCEKSYNLIKKTEDEMREDIWGNIIAFIPTNAKERLSPIFTAGKQCVDIVKSKLKLSDIQAKKKVIEMFKLIKMPDPENNFYNYLDELSGGMAQRILLAIAFLMSPKLLLADEPTLGLDLTIQKQVLDLMKYLIEKNKLSAIIATRDLGIVANYCSKVIVLEKGNIVEINEVNDFFRHPKHEHSFQLLKASFATFEGKEILPNKIK